MTPFQAVLVVAALLCSLVAGFLFAFAAVVMPGLRTLDDRSFIRAFQVIDGVIRNNQPLFVFVWVGSVLAIVSAAALGVWALTGFDRALIIVAAFAYLIGVQAPTFTVNIPLNNQLQGLDVAAMSEGATRRARDTFEARWNRSNVVRTVSATVVSALLILLLQA